MYINRYLNCSWSLSYDTALNAQLYLLGSEVIFCYWCLIYIHAHFYVETTGEGFRFGVDCSSKITVRYEFNL